MRTRNLKRLLSLLLCLCIVTGLLPVTALAADVPAITTETLEAAMVGEEYTAVLEAEASDPSGTLTWEAEGLPAWLELWDNADGTASLTGKPGDVGEFTFTVTVTETIPAAEPEEPAAQEAGPDGVTEPAGESQSTVLTASRTYALTVAEAVRAEPEPEPGITNGITPLAVTKKVQLDFNLYLQPADGGSLDLDRDKITWFSAGNRLYLRMNNYPGTHPTKIALISSSLNVGNLNETNLDNNAMVLAVGDGNGSMTFSGGILMVTDFRIIDSNGSAPDGLADGSRYRFLVWDGAEGGNQTVYYSSETYTYTADNAIPMTVTKGEQSVTSFANTDTITITATLPTAPTSVTSVFFVDSQYATSETYMYLEDGSVTPSGNTVTITMNGLYEGRSYAPGTKDGLIMPGTYNIILYDDSSEGSIKYISTATYTVTGEDGTGNNTCSVSFDTDPNFENPVTSVTPSSTEYYVRATDFSPALPYGSQYGVMIKATGSSAVYTLTGTPSSEQDASGNTAYLQRGPIVFQLDGQNTEPAAGTYDLTVSVYENAGMTGEPLYTYTSTNQMTVAAPTVSTPAITTNSPLPDGMTGQAYRRTLSANPGTPGKAVTWSLSADKPAWLSIDAAKGVLSGTPTKAGTYTFTVTAKEADGGEASKSFTITVRESLQITTESLPNATLGLYYNRTLSANLTGVTWSLKEGGSLPPGLSLMSYSDYSRISGTPTTAGTYTFTVVATDGTQTAERQFTITVSNTFTFTSNGVDSDAVGAYCYLTAEQNGRTITLWSGKYSQDQAIPVSTRYAGAEVSGVKLYTYLSRSGEVVLASYTEAITLTDDEKAALTAESDPIVTLPDIQQDFDPDVASGVTVRPYYKDSQGYNFSGGDLVANTSTTYTLCASISNGDQEFYQKYDTRSEPTFTVGEKKTNTFRLPGDLDKTVSMTYPEWGRQDVAFTLVPKAGKAADLSGFRLAFSQSLRNTTYTVTEKIGEGDTVTVQLYTGQPVSVTFYDSDLYRITSPYIPDFGAETDIPYQKNSVSGARIGVTASLADGVTEDFWEYAAKLSGSYLRPSVTASDKTTWQVYNSAPASRLVTTEGKPKTYTLNVYSSRYADALEALIKGGGTYHLAWADNGAVIAGRQDDLRWTENNLYTDAAVTLNLRGGLLLDLNFSGSKSYQQMVGWWYRQDGNDGNIWLRADTTGVFPGQRSYAFFCPGDPDIYNFILLPNEAMSPTGMAWDEVVAAYSGMPQVTGITVANNRVVRKSASMTDTFFANAKYDTLPNSTLSGPEQYSSLTDALTFTGHIELDEGKQGEMHTLRIKAAGTDSGGRVATQISSVVVNGVKYPYLGIELAKKTDYDQLRSKQFQTYYQITFTNPVELPCDISIYGKPMRLSSHCVLDVTAQVEVNGKSGKSWQPVGTATAKAPTISVEMPQYTSGGTVLAYLSIPGGGTVDVYDGDVLVLSRVSRGAVSIPLSGTAKGRSTTHTLTFQSNTQLEPVSQTVVHLDGVPKLTSQYLQVSGNKGRTWGNYGRGSIYSYASGSPPLFRATCTIENAGNIAGSVVFRVDRLDGTTAYMAAIQDGNKFTTNAFSGLPVIGATALFEPNWDTIQRILPNQMPDLPEDSPSETLTGLAHVKFAETVVVPYEEHRLQLPENETVKPLTAEEIRAIEAFQDEIERIYADHGDQARFYQIIDIGTGQFTSAHDMITRLDTNSIPQGDTGTTTMTRPLSPTELTTELGSGSGDWSRYTFTEPNGDTGLEVYTQTVTTGGGAGEGGVSGTITIATDGVTTVEFATAQGTGTGSGGFNLPESSDHYQPSGGGSGFSFTNFGSDGMNVFTNICGDVTAGSGLIKDITAAVTGAEATGVFSPLEKGLGAFTFAKDMMDGMSSQLTLADLLNAPNKWLSSRCAQKLSPEFRANMQRQINYFIQDVRDAEGWNMAVTGTNYILGAGGMAGLFTNPWTGIIGGAAAWCAGKISGMKLDNVQKQAVLLKDIIDLQIEKTARARGDMECMGVSGTRHSYAVCIDPSGIVYEAVLSNPVEGATVKLYTDGTGAVPVYSKLQDGENEFDDYSATPTMTGGSGTSILTTPEENTTIPGETVLTTGADGKFKWMVPQGLWYVTAEKEGYESGDSGKDIAAVVNAGGLNWLPVLPEQLNVNIPLISYDAPEAEVEFRSDGVYIQFSKYMDDTTLTKDNFTLTNGDQNVDFTVVKLDSEQAPDNINYDGDAPWYTSQVKLAADLSEGAAVSLTIGQDVETYAGIDWGGTEDITGTVADAAVVNAPEFGTPDKEAYGTTVTLTIPEGAAVYYTTDDTDPSETNGTRYYGETILLTDTATIKAIAVKLGVKSSVVGRTFTVEKPADAEIGDPNNQPGGDDEPDEPTPVVPGGTSDSKDDSYSVSVPAMSDIRGGSITVSPRSADKGDTVTITVKPDDGYELNTLTVTDAKGNELELTDKGSGKYTFSMPGSSVNIQVSFREITEPASNPFTDVYESDYYYDAVLWAVANGVTNGTSATTFSPNAPVTRAQMVTFLWRAYGSPRATGSNPFADVSADAYYYDAVLWAVANGVTNGTSATTFSPDAPVTRSQAVTFQWRAAGSPVVAGDSFDDVAADAYYAGAVTWAVANGITNGTGGNKFSPEVTVTRAQSVTFLWRELA